MYDILELYQIFLAHRSEWLDAALLQGAYVRYAYIHTQHIADVQDLLHCLHREICISLIRLASRTVVRRLRYRAVRRTYRKTN